MADLTILSLGPAAVQTEVWPHKRVYPDDLIYDDGAVFPDDMPAVDFLRWLLGPTVNAPADAVTAAAVSTAESAVVSLP